MKKGFAFLLFFASFFFCFGQNSHYRLLIGTYTKTGKSEGIYSYDIDMKKGVFTQKSVAKELENPSFITLTPDKKFVYAISESGKASLAGAFRFDESSGRFTFINSSGTKGTGPCYVSATDRHVVTANYGGGSISVFGRNGDGSLSTVLQVIQHTGKSIDTVRQTKPYVHQVVFTPDEKFLLVNDLGTDKVTVYQYDKNSVSNVLVPFDSVSVRPGSGPRHLTLSKNGRYVYLLHEMGGDVTVMQLNGGRLKIIQKTTVVPNPGVETAAADIHLSPDGKFLYASNRGSANNITCFSVAKDGKLTFVRSYPTGGIGPRNFAITPDGRYLFVGNQRTDNIVIFKRDKQTGALTDTGKRLERGAPVCLIFY